MIKNIIFDVDGTLIDTTHVNIKGLKKILADENINKCLDDLMDYDGLPGQKALELLGVNNIDRLHKNWVSYVNEHKEDFRIYYAIPSVLKLLCSNYNLSLVTSRTRSEIVTDEKLIYLMKYFQGYVCSDDTIRHKPEPDPILEAIDRYGYNKEETIYIGDSHHDYKSASRSGIRFFKAEWGRKKFDVTEPHVCLKTPIDLIMYLE